MSQHCIFNLLNGLMRIRELLKPPVNNKVIWQDSEFIAMIQSEVNRRRDFHVDPSDEFFYQIKGECYDYITEDGEVITVRRGCIHATRFGTFTIALPFL